MADSQMSQLADGRKCDAQTREDVLLNGVVQGEGL